MYQGRPPVVAVPPKLWKLYRQSFKTLWNQLDFNFTKAYCHVPRPATWCSPACAALDAYLEPSSDVDPQDATFTRHHRSWRGNWRYQRKGPIGPYFPLGPWFVGRIIFSFELRNTQVGMFVISSELRNTWTNVCIQFRIEKYMSRNVCYWFRIEKYTSRNVCY